jgi:hypothetical protein
MTFFNKKEEVLDIKLTPHGRYLLSIGKLKPAYYCFVDDDVVYDSQAMGYTETQNDANKRILEETPKLKTIPARFGVEENFKQMEADDYTIESPRQNRSERKLDRYPEKLGKSSVVSSRTPSIHVAALSGEFTFLSHYYTGSNPQLVNTVGISGSSISQVIAMPQLSMNPEYGITARMLSYGETPPWEFQANAGMDTAGNDLNEYSAIFSDNSYLRIQPTIPLLYFKEFNSFNHKENFDIEVFEIEETSGQIPIYKPLKFSKAYGTKIVNDLLVEKDSLSSTMAIEQTAGDEESKFVSYYFDIFVDNEIAPEDLCEHIFQAAEKNIYLDEDINCPDKVIQRFDIYGTRVSPSDLERCD